MKKYTKDYTKDKKYLLYVHVFPNGKMYVGITCINPFRRWRNGLGYRNQPLMKRAIDKYGWNNIRHVIMYENLDYDTAVWKERLLIKLFNTNSYNDNSNGYNCDNGGEGAKGHKVSEKAKENMRKAQVKTPEWRKHISEGRKNANIVPWNKGLKMPEGWNKSPIRWDSKNNPRNSKVEYNGTVYCSKMQCWKENFSDKINYDAFKACINRLSNGGKIVKKEYQNLHLEDVIILGKN